MLSLSTFLSAAAMLSTSLTLSLSAAADEAVPSIYSLPRPLLSTILLLQPVSTRLRCSEVSRAWRALLADTKLWERLKFSDEALIGTKRFEALFNAAVAKAGGQLRELDVSSKFSFDPHLTHAALMKAVVTNSHTLQRLRLCSGYELEVVESSLTTTTPQLVELCDAVPGLQKLVAKVECSPAEARALLRREPPFGALNLCCVHVDFALDDNEDAFLSCVDDLQVHGACLESLMLYGPRFVGVSSRRGHLDASHEFDCVEYHARLVVCAWPGAPVGRGEHFFARAWL